MEKRKIAIIFLALVALAGLCYVLWGFWLGFLGLSLVYTALAVAIVYLLARHYDADFKEYLKNNNTLFFVLLGASAVTFVIACFHFGPAVLLPEKFPTPEQRGVGSDMLNHLLYGKNAPAKSVPTEPLPWATGTWFWWKALGLYALLTFAYFWFAFWDEASHAVHAIVDLVRRRRREEHSGQTDSHDDHDGEPSFSKLLKVEFLAEIVVEFVKFFIAKRKENRS